jgi:hypothetical protein
MQQLEMYRAIADQYRKFDFRLERCLMTDETIAALKGEQTFLDSPVETAKLDAMWFSRKSGSETVAWEIRLVSSTPVSLLEKIPVSLSDSERGAKLKEMETRLQELMDSRRAAIEEIIAENAGAPDDEDDDDEEPVNEKPKGNGRYKRS